MPNDERRFAKFIERRKRSDAKFAKDFESRYQEFKIGILLRQAREQAGVTPGDPCPPNQNEKIDHFAARESCSGRPAFHNHTYRECLGKVVANRISGSLTGWVRFATNDMNIDLGLQPQRLLQITFSRLDFSF